MSFKTIGYVIKSILFADVKDILRIMFDFIAVTYYFVNLEIVPTLENLVQKFSDFCQFYKFSLDKVILAFIAGLFVCWFKMAQTLDRAEKVFLFFVPIEYYSKEGVRYEMYAELFVQKKQHIEMDKRVNGIK